MTMKIVDLSKLQKSITTKMPGVSTGFHDPKTWITTNNYVLNFLISGKFNRGIPLSTISMLAGQSGSGKSLIAACVMKEALEQGITVVAFDSENGLTKEWLAKAGIDVTKYDASEGGNGQFMRIQVSMIDNLSQTFFGFLEHYEKEYKDDDNPPKMLFVIDSLGMLMTPTEVKQAEGGDLKGDFGRKPKALNQLVRNSVVRLAELDVGLLCTNHSYQSQDMFNPDDIVSGGSGFIYASSIVVAMQKLKLKEDENGDKITDVAGIRAKVQVMKTRFNKPFENVTINIPYDKGIDPYSGLFDFFLKSGILQKEKNTYYYTDINGEVQKSSRKGFMTPEGKKLFDKMMDEYDQKSSAIEMPDIEELNEEYENQED